MRINKPIPVRVDELELDALFPPFLKITIKIKAVAPSTFVYV
jgi:hypothetical protein